MNQEQRRAEIERLWRDPSSRKGWGLMGVYYQPRDPRLVVPKFVIRLGWTVNFAHPWAIPATILGIILTPMPALCAVGLAMWLKLSILGSILLVGGAQLLTITALCLICSRLAARYD